MLRLGRVVEVDRVALDCGHRHDVDLTGQIGGNRAFDGLTRLDLEAVPEPVSCFCGLIALGSGSLFSSIRLRRFARVELFPRKLKDSLHIGDDRAQFA